MDDETAARLGALEFVVKRVIAQEALRTIDPEGAPAMIDAQLAAFLQGSALDPGTRAALVGLFGDAKRLAEDELAASR